MNNSKRIYRAAIYVRLSKEDGDLDDVRKAESNSISKSMFTICVPITRRIRSAAPTG